MFKLLIRMDFSTSMTLTRRILFAVIIVFLKLLMNVHLSEGTENDVYCLRSIQASLEDPHNYLSSWNFNNTKEGHICFFVGVECWHPDENKVLNINLTGMDLKGQFPRGIGNCTALTGLDLSHNKLHGTIPSDISELLPFATTIDLSWNDFSGRIPPSLANCSYLNNLRLDHNRLRGRIPPQLGLLPRIRNFSVTNNLLSGPVPKFVCASIPKESYANNSGLCGYPLDPCGSR